MTILNRLASNWSRVEREKLNTNWSIIENYLSNLQRQINLLTGDVNVQELIDKINDIFNQGNVIIGDLEAALQDATTVINNAQNATTEANNAAQDALNAINDMQAFISQFGNAETYDNSKLYKINNIVEFDGSGFICIQNTQGNQPPTLPTKRNEWWQLIAQRGVDGTGAVSKVAGKSPEVDGNVLLTAQDIGAASGADFDKLFNLSPSVLKIPLPFNYRGWQGVTVFNNLIYVVTDRNENFGLENIVSVYTLDGKLVMEKRNAYTGLDPQGKFMSFGDMNEIDGYLYVTAYNINGGGNPFISRVVKYNPTDLSVVNEYEIGGNIAESVTKHDNHFWVVYHDVFVIRKFDLSFNFIQEYELTVDTHPQGGFQGSLWEDHYFYANLHSHNSIGDETPFAELRKYQFDGTKFIFIEKIAPPTIGCGQGLSKYDEYYFWNDRTENNIVITKGLKSGKIFAVVAPITKQQSTEPSLLNGYTPYTSTRTVKVTLKDGIVYLSGIIKVPTLFEPGNDSKPPFFIPPLMSDTTNRNFIVATNLGFIKVAIASNISSFNSRKVVVGLAGQDVSGITWISFDGISYPLLS